MHFNLKITREQHAGLKAIATERRITIKRLLQDFIADVTDSLNRGGSDEAMYAREWLDRRCYIRPSTPCTAIHEYSSLPSAEVDRREAWADRWNSLAWRARERLRKTFV